ncbi:exopolygalacturonase [Quercus suber]|uniref:Exopolygalacturonase n=1 Tax=Quercus suber TaxID=58331 RepID=A0AAW0LB17_QUESU
MEDLADRATTLVANPAPVGLYSFWVGFTVYTLTHHEFRKHCVPINNNLENNYHYKYRDDSPLKVKISNVSFKNIRGTSSTKEALKLICSNSVPCQQVMVVDIDLVYKGVGGSATSTCVNVKPTVLGKKNPLASTIKQ